VTVQVVALPVQAPNQPPKVEPEFSGYVPIFFLSDFLLVVKSINGVRGPRPGIY
jgi:hypothetical protein